MRGKMSIWVVGAVFALASAARAGTVGDIQGVYNATNPYGIAPGNDGPAFVIENTSATNITNGVLNILAGNGVAVADSFVVGTVAAGARVIVIPGISDDGGAGHTFFHTGGLLDTSDVGPNGDGVQFRFTGLQGALTVDSGIFTPATSVAPSNDGTIASMNFLGGGPQSDGPCNDCYGPHIIADLNTPSATPEPASITLVGIGILALAGYGWRRKRMAM